MVKLANIFAGHLRVRRKAMGFTQEQLAERSGFSANYIARLELGTSIPSLSTLAKLSKALRIGVPDLLTNEPQPVSADDVCAVLLLPLNDQETEYVLTQLRSTVNFVLSLRKIKQDDQ